MPSTYGDSRKSEQREEQQYQQGEQVKQHRRLSQKNKPDRRPADSHFAARIEAAIHSSNMSSHTGSNSRLVLPQWPVLENQAQLAHCSGAIEVTLKERVASGIDAAPSATVCRWRYLKRDCDLSSARSVHHHKKSPGVSLF